MRDILIVFRKELTEAIRDRRTLTAIVLQVAFSPLLIGFSTSVEVQNATKTVKVSYDGSLPQGIEPFMTEAKVDLISSDDPTGDVRDSSVDVALHFTPGGVDLIYDPNRSGSSTSESRVTTALDLYNKQVSAVSLAKKGVTLKDLDPLLVTNKPIVNPSRAAGALLLSFLLPFLLLTAAATGGMSAALDGTAGERERFTLHTLLMTPASRTSILLGKLGAVTVLNFLGLTISLLTMLFVLSRNRIPVQGGQPVTISLPTEAEIVMLFLGLLLAIFFGTVMLALGTLAKTYRQGQAYVTPIYIVAIGMATVVLIVPDFKPGLIAYFVPVLDVVMTMQETVRQELSTAHLAITTATLLVASGVALYIARHLFQREALVTSA